MSFKLNYIEFISRGANGWSSKRIDLSKNVTIILGENGSGKTPLITGLIYALGGTVEIPVEIKKNCSKVIVSFFFEKTPYLIERNIDDSEFRAYVSKLNESTRLLLTSEKEFSDWFLETVSIEQRTITSRNQNAPTCIYLSTLIPMFCIEQDHGWGTTYYAPMNRRFIKSQEEEMVRVFLGLSARFQHVSKQDETFIRERISKLEDHISHLKKNIANEEAMIVKDYGNLEEDEIIKRKEELMRDLDRLQEGADNIKVVTSSLDIDLENNRIEFEKCNTNRLKLQLEAKKYLRVIDGLEEESKMLSDNDKAISIFKSLCSNGATCAMFKHNEDSYGRRLLFLQDQKKDIVGQYDEVQFKLKQIDKMVLELEKHREEIETKRLDSITKVQLSDVSNRVKERVKELAIIERKLSKLDSLKKIKEQYNESFVRLKDFNQKLVDTCSSSKKQQSERDIEVRDIFREKLETWLSTLRTPNLDPRVVINNDFSFNIGNVKFTNDSEHSGSTRLRIILAYHAAILETSLEIGGNHPGVLIFDTPKQHELKEEDLKNYFNSFRKLMRKYADNVQLVLAVKDLPFSPEEEDFIWQPSFNGEDGKKFFGPNESE